MRAMVARSQTEWMHSTRETMFPGPQEPWLISASRDKTLKV